MKSETEEKPLRAHAPVRRPPPRLRPLVLFFGVLALVVVLVVAGGIVPRLRRQRRLDAAAVVERHQNPIANVIAAHITSATTPLDLPGELKALVETAVFARADGYVVKRNVDIGDRVQSGQVLAQIEMPELDQQVQQARATLANSQSSMAELQANIELADANMKLAQSTNQRWNALEQKGTVSHQEADEKAASFAMRRAEAAQARARLASEKQIIAANEANLRRLQELKGFSRVAAPFTGVITARNIDVGSLIDSGNGGTAKEMFRIAQIGTMRIFVNVPQAYVGDIRTGAKAEVRVQELPGEVFQATVTRSAHEVDASTRSMLTILEAPNPKGILLPGMYAQVRFETVRSQPGVVIPGDALVLGPKGAVVAVVDSTSTVHFRTVKVGVDYGGEVEIASGLSPGDLVVTNPTDAIQEGVHVDVRKIGHS